MVVRKGASLIQTDRPAQLLQYLKRRADDEKIGICCLGLLFSLCSYAQVQREYHLISTEKVENKAYYFTALLREFGEVDSMICHDPVLKKWD